MSENLTSRSRYTQIVRERVMPNSSILDLKVTAPDLGGEQFLSTCECISVRGQNGEKVELFAKRIVDDPEYAKVIRNMNVFPKEAGFLNDVYPELVQFVKERAKPGTNYAMDMVPRCYFASEEMIVMENLKERGYFLLDKMQRQDLDAARLYMQTLAKFNAPSYLLIKEEQSPGDFIRKFPSLTDNWVRRHDNKEKKKNGWLESLMEAAHKILQTHSKDFENGSDALKALEKMKDNLMDIMVNPLRPEDNHVCYVVNHGDSWTNNHLFHRNSDSQELDHLVLCDFQIVRVASPSIDLSVYIFSSVKPEIRQNQWKFLIRLYYESLKENVELLDGQLDFSFEQLLADYRRRCVHGFILGVTTLAFDYANSKSDKSSENGNPLESVDEETGDDDVADVFGSGAIGKWMKKCPMQVKKCAGEIVAMFQEYEQQLNSISL